MKAWILGPLLVAACAGTKLHDVGDIPGDGGAGGSAGETGSDGRAGGKAEPPNPPGEGGAAGTPFTPTVGGTGDITEPTEGGNGPGLVELQCEACEVVSAAADIRDVAVGADHVFWLEYGTFDHLGNHQDDGRLMAMPLAGGEPEVIAADLQRPLLLSLSEEFGYVVVEGSAEATGERQLLRVALDGGAETVLQALPEHFGGTLQEPVRDWNRRFLTTRAGVAYWAVDELVYRLAEDAAGPPEELLETDGVFYVSSDAAQLYVYDVEGIKSLPFTGGAPSLIKAIEPVFGFAAYETFATSGEFFYAYDMRENFLLRMPTTGGSWKRVLESDYPTRFIVEGDQYFVDPSYRPQPGNALGNSLRQGNFGDPESETTLAIGPFGPFYAWRGWDISAAFVYFGYDSELFRVPRAD